MPAILLKPIIFSFLCMTIIPSGLMSAHTGVFTNYCEVEAQTSSLVGHELLGNFDKMKQNASAACIIFAYSVSVWMLRTMHVN